MSDLKNCPFCGSGAIEVCDWEEYTQIGCLDCDYAIKCRDCDEDDAVDWWNTRPAEDALTTEIERLKEALKQIAYLRNLNPDMKASKFSSCAEDDLRNFYCTMGDIAIQALGTDTNVPANAPDMNDGKMEEA